VNPNPHELAPLVAVGASIGINGLELPPETTGNTGDSLRGGVNCAASGPVDAGLAAVVAAWADLPPAIRRAVLALIDDRGDQ